MVQHLLKDPRVLSTINHQSEVGATAVLEASYNGYGQVVRVLLESQADPMIMVNRGHAARKGAKLRGHRACVALLQVLLYIALALRYTGEGH